MFGHATAYETTTTGPTTLFDLGFTWRYVFYRASSHTCTRAKDTSTSANRTDVHVTCAKRHTNYRLSIQRMHFIDGMNFGLDGEFCDQASVNVTCFYVFVIVTSALNNHMTSNLL